MVRQRLLNLGQASGRPGGADSERFNVVQEFGLECVTSQMTPSTRVRLRYVYRLKDAEALPANLALEAYLAALADDQPGVEFRKTEAFTIIEEAQVRARAAGWAGDIWSGEGVGAGPFVSLSPGKLTGGGTGILALYWTVSGEATTYVVSALLLPYLGTPFRTEGFELRSPEFLHDMSAWCIEKSTALLQDALYIKRELGRASDLPEGTKEQIMLHLSHLAWNGTKLLAFSGGGEWGTDDARTVLEEEEGLDLVLVKYGLRDETSGQEAARLLREFLRDIRELLEGPRVPNLGELHALLHESWDGGDVAEQLVAWEDEVQMGILSWEEFCARARGLIDDQG